MTTDLCTEKDSFQAELTRHYAQMAPGSAMQKYHASAWERFLQIGLPAYKQEAYRYLNLRSLFTQQYILSKASAFSAETIASYVYPECKNSLLVIVNGHYRPDLSNTTALGKKNILLPIHEATRTYNSLLQNQWTRWIKEETDPFALLNGALHQEGLFLYIPPKTVVDVPIQILHLIDTPDQLVTPRVHLFLGAHSQATLLATLAPLSGEAYCLNQVVEIAIEEGASLKYIETNSKEIPSKAWHFEAVRATLKRDSAFETVCVTEGSSSVRHDYRVALTGENAEVKLNGIWMLSENREAHTHILVDHQAPHCRSMQFFKGALDDFSKSSFEGKIFVRQAAQKTEAFQLNNNLLLNDRAQAYSKPNLEIFADDVKASHGATVGQLNEEQLFYLKTRGFSIRDAKSLLTYSFCKEVIDLIPVSSIREQATERAKVWLSEEKQHP